MSEDLRPRVEGWLEALGCAPVERPDPMAHWHLSFEYPIGSGHRMLSAGLTGAEPAIIVASVVTLSPEHVEAFDELMEDDKRAFLFGLRRSLNRLEADFQLGGMSGPLTCPTSFQVSARRFADGLSLDVFARTVAGVYKTELEGIWFIQEWLDVPDGGGMAVQFDFNSADLPQA